MKAWVLHNIEDIRLEEVLEPILKENEVLVQVKAVGICGSDIPRIYKDGAHKMPLILGHEFSGKIVKTGANVDIEWLEKSVGVFPLIPCKSCVPCQKKQYEMCRNYSYLGSRQDGAFAEYVVVPEWNLIPLPEGVSYQEAAMLEPMAVSVHAIRRLEIQTEDTIVIYGLGTIGLLLCMFLQSKRKEERHTGKILVIGNKDFQKERILALGIKEENYCDSRKYNVNEWVMKQTKNNGAEIFFECIGKSETILAAVDLTAAAGQICFVGNPYTDVTLEKATYWKILRNQLRITGTWNSSYTHEEDDDWHYVLSQLQQKKVLPEVFITHHFNLSELEKGFSIMREKKEDYIKIMGIMKF